MAETVPTKRACDVNFDGRVLNGDTAAALQQVGETVVAETLRHTDFVFDVTRGGSITLSDVGAIVANVGVQGGPADTGYRGRNPYLQPFAVDSIWNTPLGASGTRQAANLTPPNVTFCDDDVIIMCPDYPITPVWETNLAEAPIFNPWNGASRCTRFVPNNNLAAGCPGGGVPLPMTSTVPDSNGADGLTPNHGAAILLKDRRTVFQTQPLTHCGTNGDWTSAYNFGATSTGLTDLWGHGIFGAHGGSDLSAIGGTIRLWELQPGGVIPHALKIVVTADQLYYNTSTLGLYARSAAVDGQFAYGHRWPARTVDYGAPSDYTGTNPNLTMGSLLALPTNFNVASLITEPAQIIATALKKYGAYVCDTGGDSGFRAYYFPTERAGQTPHGYQQQIAGGGPFKTAPPGPRVVDNFEVHWPTLGAFSEVRSGDWFDDNVTICAALEIVTDSGPGTQTGTATSVTPNSMYDATNDWWQSFNLAGAVLTMGGKTLTVTSNSTSDGTLIGSAGWNGNGSPPPAVGAYSLAMSGTIGGAGTRLAALAPTIGTGP